MYLKLSLISTVSFQTYVIESREWPVVTKKEIVKTISEECGLTQLKTKEIVQKTFEAIIDTLVTEGRIELRNFGVFEVKRRAPRKARNPRSGEKVEVPEKFVVTFKPGKEMEQRVLDLQKASTEQNEVPAPPAVPPPSPTPLPQVNQTPTTTIQPPMNSPPTPPPVERPGGEI